METTEKTARPGFNGKQFIIWTSALIVGLILGSLHCCCLNSILDFVASVFTRLFQFVAVPTIALAVCTTLATLGARKDTGRIFLHTLKYTLLTTFAATIVGALLYWFIKPGNISADLIAKGAEKVASDGKTLTYAQHILSVVPNNIINPFLSGNVLSIILIAAAVGLTLAILPKNENLDTLKKAIFGLQELLFGFIKGLVWILPVGIIAFAGQLAAQMQTGGTVTSAISKYVLVVVGGNLIQFFVVLPLFLLVRGVNPLKVFRGLLPAILMALFTKSSAATLPVNIACTEKNLKVRPTLSRFILPLCCTINMNGCAAFILVTSLFVLQNGGLVITLPIVLLWMCIAVFSAVGNAGVPMGCYFLTLSLMSGMGAPIGIMGIILPVYAMIDMIETAINISSDACICAILNKHLPASEEEN